MLNTSDGGLVSFRTEMLILGIGAPVFPLVRCTCRNAAFGQSNGDLCLWVLRCDVNFGRLGLTGVACAEA